MGLSPSEYPCHPSIDHIDRIPDKTMKYLSHIFILTIVMMGCAKTHVSLVDASRSYAPTHQVEFLTDEPNRPYEVIAFIEARGSQHDHLRTAIRRAGRIGAHAILLLDTEGQPAQIKPRVIQQGQFVVNDYAEMATSRFKAIRYKPVDPH
jgi:hypothetical protein